jgi:hypothetical protein
MKRGGDGARMRRTPAAEQKKIFNPDLGDRAPESAAKVCTLCAAVGVLRVATRLVAKNPSARSDAGVQARTAKGVTPMCTRHASANWQPSPSLAPITVAGEVPRD